MAILGLRSCSGDEFILPAVQLCYDPLQTEIAALLEKERDGTVSDADRHRLDEIKDRFVEVMLEIGAFGERLNSPSAASNGRRVARDLDNCCFGFCYARCGIPDRFPDDLLKGGLILECDRLLQNLSACAAAHSQGSPWERCK